MRWSLRQGVTANGYNVSFGGDEKTLKLQIMVMVAQFHKYLKTIELCTLNGRMIFYVNYTLVKLYKNQ